VAVLGGHYPVFPSDETQYIVLLDREGELLDRLSCGISNRLTRMYVDSGTFLTDVLDAPAADGARLIIRYIPEKGGSMPGNFSYELSQGAKTHTLSNEWDNGLCRVAVRDGKLVSVFPKLE